MRNLFYLLLIGSIIYLGSCTTKGNAQNDSSDNVSSSLLDSMGDVQVELYVGSLILGPEEHSIKDCLTKKVWWIDDQTQDNLFEQYKAMTDKPYQGVYAEVKGYLQEVPQDGFASEYEKLLVVTEIIKLDDLDVDNDCSIEQNVENVN